MKNEIKNPHSLLHRIDVLAHECIHGTFGNGRERKKKLGHMYDLVQARVNQIYDNERFKNKMMSRGNDNGRNI